MSENFGDPFKAEDSRPMAKRQGKAALSSNGIKGPLAGAISTVALLAVQQLWPDADAAEVTAVISVFISLGVAAYGRWTAKQEITSIF